MGGTSFERLRREQWMRQQASINLLFLIQRDRPTHLLEFWLSGRHLVGFVDLEVWGGPSRWEEAWL